MKKKSKENIIEFKAVDKLFSIKIFYTLIIAITIITVVYFLLNRQISNINDDMDNIQSYIDENVSNNTPILPVENLQKIDKTFSNETIICSNLIKQITFIIKLRDLLISGQDYATEIDNIKTYFAHDNNIVESVLALEKYSESHINNFDKLKEKFDNIIKPIILISRKNNENGKIESLFNNLIFIRRIGNVAIKYGGIEEIIAKTEIALSNKDLKKAISELSEIRLLHINDEAKNIANIWINQSLNFLNIIKHAEHIYTYFTTALKCQSDDDK